MNRLFFDHGEESILEAVKQALSKDDPVIVNSLEFVSKSLLQYQKQSWIVLLKRDLKGTLMSLSATGNYFARVKSVEILYQLARNDVKSLQGYYLWLPDQFYIHYDHGTDPLLLYTIFDKLNTKYGGTWVYDYEIDMITKLLGHSSPAMQYIGSACFESMNADRDEVPESLWHLTDSVKSKFPLDFFEFRMAFEEKLRKENQFNYRLSELETFVIDQTKQRGT